MRTHVWSEFGCSLCYLGEALLQQTRQQAWT